MESCCINPHPRLVNSFNCLCFPLQKKLKCATHNFYFSHCVLSYILTFLLTFLLFLTLWNVLWIILFLTFAISTSLLVLPLFFLPRYFVFFSPRTAPSSLRSPPIFHFACFLSLVRLYCYKYSVQILWIRCSFLREQQVVNNFWTSYKHCDQFILCR